MSVRGRFRLVLGLALVGVVNVVSVRASEITATSEPQSVIAGPGRVISVKLHSHGSRTVTADVRVRLVQTSCATAVGFVEQPWKSVKVLPGQTVLESITLDFPAVRAETRFLLRWTEGVSNIIGQTEVSVYPTNLLAQLKTLAGGGPLGVFDPDEQLKPVLRQLAVEFQDLRENGTDKFRGKLAIFGPFESKTQLRTGLTDDIRTLARRGVAVVWLQPPPGKNAVLKSSYYIVREADGAVVVAGHSLVAQLAERPEAQLNLLRLAEEALCPTPLSLPETEIKS